MNSPIYPGYLYVWRTALFSGALITVPMGSVAAASLPIGVNFNVGSNLDPAEAAGAASYSQTNWNNLGAEGGPVALVDGTGAATTVQIQWASNNGWNDGANPGTSADQRLMRDYLDSGGAVNGVFDGFGSNDDEPLILLTGLDGWLSANGFTSYSIVIYSDGDDASGQRATRVWLASTGGTVGGVPGLGSDLTARIEITDTANFGATETYVEVTQSGAAGNYTVFKGQTADAVYVRTEEAGAVPFRGPINAIQIIGIDAALSDSDLDGLPDLWELAWGLDPDDDGSVQPRNGPSGDPDGDGRTNLQEYNGGANGTNPVLADSDEDGLDDGEEFAAGTNPNVTDSDGDGLPDGWEVEYGLSPLDDGTTAVVNGPIGDPDEDGLDNQTEYLLGIHPNNGDTDGDGYGDEVEDFIGDWGGVDFTGTDPRFADTDSDGFPDGDENPDLEHVTGTVLGTDPNLEDSDGDGVNDRWETLLGLDPTDAGPTQSLPLVPLVNPSFEDPVTATLVYGEPVGWTLDPPQPAGTAVYVENIAGVSMSGGAGENMTSIELTDAVLFQDSGVAFEPNTTYIVDLASGKRKDWSSGRVEFGLRVGTGSGPGTPLAVEPGWMEIGGVPSASGNPDADNRIGRLRSASVLSNLGSGALGQPFSFVTGATPPTGNIVAYVHKVTDQNRVYFDDFRIFAVPNSLDTDADGLPDGWELANRLDPNISEGDDGAAGDPDLDGFTNAEELAGGSNPALASSVPVVQEPSVVSSGLVDGTFVLEVTGLRPDRAYQLMRSTDLVLFGPLGSPVTGVSSQIFVDEAPLEGKAFYQVEEQP